jgi:stage II sporulation protein D
MICACSIPPPQVFKRPVTRPHLKVGTVWRTALFVLILLLALQPQLHSQGSSHTSIDTAVMDSSVRSDSHSVRIGLLEAYERLTFQMHGDYSVVSLGGQEVREAKPSALRWRVRAEQVVPAQFLFSVLVASFKSRDNALALAETFEAKSIPAIVRQIGGPIEVDGRVIGDNTLYRVQVGNFKTEADAQPLIESLEDDYVPRLVREVLRNSKGSMELFDADLNENFTIKEGFRLVPSSPDCHVTIFGVLTGSGFKYEKAENRDYAGILEVYFDHEGKLAVISEIPIDVYLQGVVPSEMPAGFPDEALKAQAVLARSVVLAEKTTKHLNDPFELCAHVHCQVYSGITQEDPRTTAAVLATKGMVLVNDGHLLEAHYSAVCGGHTEDAEATWATPFSSAMEGRSCAVDSTLVLPDLTTETGVRKYILSTPNVCCNLTGHDLPLPADYGRRHFRWEVSYSRQELEGIIRDKTGVDVGTLFDILPVRRGKSGRLMEVEILGSRRNLRLKRELKIRRALSHSALESSCFIVDVVQDGDGMPLEFVLSGAGWGHGVGMCQCGAAHLADHGMKYDDIIHFYFPGASVEKIY